MTVSDSLPIQFWPVTQQTHNQKEICGFTAPKCFCQPINCAGEQIVQFQGDPSFTPVTDFLTSDINGGDVDWTLSPVPTVEVSGGGPYSYYAYAAIPVTVGNTYRFRYDVTFASATDPSLQDTTLLVHVLDGSLASVDSFTVAFTLGQALNQSGILDITPTGNGVYIALEYLTLDGPAISVTVNEFDYNDVTYTLVLLDEDNVTYFQEELTEVSDGVYQTTIDFNALSPTICGTRLVAYIFQGVSAAVINSDFVSDLDGWTSDGSGDSTWIWIDGSSFGSAVVGDAFTQLNSPDTESDHLVKTVAGTQEYYRVQSTMSLYKTLGGTNQEVGMTIKFILTDGVTEQIVFEETRRVPVDDLTDYGYTFSVDKLFLSTVDFTSAYFVVTTDTSSFSFKNTDIEYLYLTQIGELVYNSDCLDVNEHDCVVDITYTNSSNFDGIVYELSPQPEFTLRIPGIFFAEENPQEREDLELSNGRIVSLRQSIVEKRLLETGYIPNYMHKKLQKALMHETITIDGDNWIMRDAYESSPIKDYGLKKGQVWLTKIDSIDRNII